MPSTTPNGAGFISATGAALAATAAGKTPGPPGAASVCNKCSRLSDKTKTLRIWESVTNTTVGAAGASYPEGVARNPGSAE